MAATTIEWCDHSINPIRARLIGTDKVGHYCEKVASGCANCYASRMQRRFGLPSFTGGSHLGDVEIFLDESKLAEVVARKKPTRYFWCDMTDIFGHWVTTAMIKRCLETVDQTPQHTHLWLTKRPEWATKVLIQVSHFRRANLWLGCSVSDQRTFNVNVPAIAAGNESARYRFLSIEPLIESIHLGEIQEWARLIDWVIVGGESGPGSRECHIEAIRDIVEECRYANVPCFVKQVGTKPVHVTDIGIRHYATTSAKGCDPNDWPSKIRVRQFPGDAT